MNIFANNLKYLRMQKKLNQDSLAKKLGISRSVLSYYESGKSDPTLSILYKIAIFFNVSLDSLVSDNLSNVDSNINSDFNYNNFCISNLLKSLESSKDYYLKEKERLYNIINFDIPNKINEIDEIINFMKILENNNIDSLENLSDISNSSSNSSNEITATLESDTNIKTNSSSSDNVLSLENYRDNKNFDLEYDQYLTREDNIDNDKYNSIPLLGKVPAGTPREAIECIEGYYNISTRNLDSHYDYFLLRVNGDSMNKLYEDNDIILVRKQTFCDNGNLVVAFLKDEESTFKRYYRYNDIIELHPESTNPIHKIQKYSPDETCILGVVLGALREYVD